MHRLKARTKLEQYLDSKQVSRSDYFSVPVGSLLWNTADSSDYDYVLCLKDREFWEELYGKYIGGPGTSNLSIIGANVLIKQELDIPSGPEYLTGNMENDAVFLQCLLFTPDELISGNLQLAQKLRLALVEYYTGDSPSERRQQILEKHFEEKYKSWEKRNKPTHGPRGVVESPVRQQRYDKVLAERSVIATRTKPDRDPEDYKKAFENARKNMHVPSIQTYLEAMRQSGGALSLLKPEQQTVVTQALP